MILKTIFAKCVGLAVDIIRDRSIANIGGRIVGSLSAQAISVTSQILSLAMSRVIDSHMY